ncbi:MAG: DMT family transporter [Sphaerochaetaceae bacterium]|nr:DMT family transporter [Sphaerochaetaceae bacterium]
MKSLYADLSILLTAVLWGTGFPGMYYALQSGLSPTFILLIRFSVASILLFILVYRKVLTMSRQDLTRGIITGIFLFIAFYAQTVGLQFTTPSNNAFITATYVIQVPFMSWILFKKRPHRKFFILPFLTFIGVVVLTYTPGTGFSFSLGDTFTLVCSVFFALHLAYLDRVSKISDVLNLTFVQLATAAVLCLLVFLTIDGSNPGEQILWPQALGWTIYLSLFCTLIAYFLQTRAQKYTTSTKAAIFLSSESLFGALFSVIAGIEPFTVFLVLGGGLILTSIILSEVRITSKTSISQPQPPLRGALVEE